MHSVVESQTREAFRESQHPAVTQFLYLNKVEGPTHYRGILSIRKTQPKAWHPAGSQGRVTGKWPLAAGQGHRAPQWQVNPPLHTMI